MLRNGRRMRWNNSTRAARLPADWAQRRRIVCERAHGRCQAERHAPECNGIGTDCDHIVQGDNHSLDNLQWLSHPCHKAKTERENAERNHMKAQQRLHPRERQPGLIQWQPSRVGGDSPA